MSLKAFHIVFVIFSVLLAVALGFWCVWLDLVDGTAHYRMGAVASFVSAALLLFYGFWFYRKMKRMGIIT